MSTSVNVMTFGAVRQHPRLQSRRKPGGTLSSFDLSLYRFLKIPHHPAKATRQSSRCGALIRFSFLVSPNFLAAQRIVKSGICYQNVRPPVRQSVTLVIHACTVQDIKIQSVRQRVSLVF